MPSAPNCFSHGDVFPIIARLITEISANRSGYNRTTSQRARVRATKDLS
jgi:hypothetical protein